MSHTLNGLTITRATVQIPRRGVWWADVEVDEPDVLSGAATLVIGTQTFVGTIVSGGSVYGRGRYRVAAGAGTWGNQLPEKGYGNDAGVKVSSVLGDAASAVGETLSSVPASLRLGPHFARPAGPASAVFAACEIADWYVGLDGVTVVGERAATTYAGDGTAQVEDAQTVRVRCDDVVGLVPGVTVGGVEACDVEIALDASKIEVTCYAANAGSTGSLVDAFARAVARVSPDPRANSTWEYRVVSQNGERLNLQIVASRFGMPDLTNVFVRQLPGVRHVWPIGSLCLVSFVNGSLARPVVTGGDAPDSPGWKPTELHVAVATQRLDVVGSTTEIGATGSTQFVSLANLTDSVFSTVRTWLNTHTHGGVTSGAAATTPPVALLTALSSTAAAHLKGN